MSVHAVITSETVIPKEMERYNVEYILEDTLKGKKESYKLKGKFAARMTPFIGILDDEGKILKGFYSEASNNVFKDYIEYEEKSK